MVVGVNGLYPVRREPSSTWFDGVSVGRVSGVSGSGQREVQFGFRGQHDGFGESDQRAIA